LVDQAKVWSADKNHIITPMWLRLAADPSAVDVFGSGLDTVSINVAELPKTIQLQPRF